MSAPSLTDSELLGRIGSVRLWLANTEDPWMPDLDTMVLSASTDGLDSFGRALCERVPEPPALDPALSRVTPTNPQRVEWPATPETAASVPGLRQVGLASVHPVGASATALMPATVATTTQAARSAVGLAIRHGARRLGIPLLGRGAPRDPTGSVA